MTPDEERHIAENEALKAAQAEAAVAVAAAQHLVAVAAALAAAQNPGQDTPLTKEEFAAQMQKLTERARAAGLNPIQTMARTYAKQGMVILEGLLASLENADNSPKKKE